MINEEIGCYDLFARNEMPNICLEQTEKVAPAEEYVMTTEL